MDFLKRLENEVGYTIYSRGKDYYSKGRASNFKLYGVDEEYYGEVVLVYKPRHKISFIVK